MISRICQEFSCTPLEALEQPHAMVLDILDLRGFARHKDIMDNAKSQEDVPDSPYTELVWQFYKEQVDQAKVERDARKASPN